MVLLLVPALTVAALANHLVQIFAVKLLVGLGLRLELC